MQELFKNIYVNRIPLPRNPLKYLNSYIFISDERNLIIDTGFNTKECEEAFMQGVKELNIDLTKTDLVLTHLHVDHTGLATKISKLGANVMIGGKDGFILNEVRKSDEHYIKVTRAYGFDRNVFGDDSDFGEREYELLQYTPLGEGDVLEIGPYKLEVLDVPGHTPGHIALYERNLKVLFAGDHILNEITPNITFWGYDFDSLGTYLKSLKKIYDFELDRVFTAHRSVVEDHRQRIEELISHHEQRLDEVSRIIRSSSYTSCEVATQMHWDMKYDSWVEFPGPQKWFASGEATSHLEHLVHEGAAKRINRDNKVYYTWA